jgi:tetratricopeptide (TPR) repeat protein
MKSTGIIGLFIFCAIMPGMAQNIEEARQHMYYERYDSAKINLRSVIANDNRQPDAYYWLAEVFLKQNDIRSAYDTLSEGIKVFSDQQLSRKKNPLIFIGLGHMYLDSGLTDLAKTSFENILEESKYKDPEALLAAAKANIESKNGNLVWAIELLNKALKRDKDNAVIYLALGDAYRKLIDGGTAILNYNKAVELAPGFAEPLYKEGLIYKTQNNAEIYINRFKKAFAADSNYTPVLYELYYYYYFLDVIQANKYLTAYIKNADPDPNHAYMVTDMQYLSAKYAEAIASAQNILANEAERSQPRIYKLMAYSYAALGDSAAALSVINSYFDKQQPDQFVSRDYELKALLLEKLNPDKNLAIEWYKKALEADTAKKESLNYMIALANLHNEMGNRQREAKWREKVYQAKPNPSNLDIYKWGTALYAAQNYVKADSVFSIYEEKYPEQVYGYLWRARSNALIDTAMLNGLAVPHYIKLVEVASADSVKNRALLLSAYQYLGAYEATITKNYTASLEYYDKVLALDPDDADAGKNVKILEKWIDKERHSN